MQVSIKWLKDYIDFDWSAEELADRLTMAGIPVENVIRADEGLDHVVTGRIDSLTAHPDSDHLQICQMNVGGEELIEIITGAQNVKEGQVVPVAMVGAHLPSGMHIKKSKLRGLPSNGMLCSAGELGIDLSKFTEEQKDGIYILPAGTPVGVPAKDVLGLDDVILEFELTANRADCFSVLGLVREIAVLTGNTPHLPEISVKEDAGEKAADLISIGIAEKDLCSRFSSRILRNVKVGPSPDWLQERLKGAGIRAISNVVDVTNFVMVELGQPMHAYDYDEINGHSLTARLAKPGENLHTLDDSSRLAKGTELVIADSAHPAGLAGVMGGLETEVTEKTTSVVLEAASFNGASIRRTSRAVGLRSEASGRFERGVDTENTLRALNRAAQLLQDMGACQVAEGIVDVYPSPKAATRIEFTAEEINRRLGTDIAEDEMKDILTKLGFTLEGSGSLTATVPSWRGDCTCMEDLSEEIARIHGFENIKSTTPNGRMVQGKQGEKQNFVERMKQILASQGLTEELSFAFTSEEQLDKLLVPEDSVLRQAIPILNPLAGDAPLVRTSLLTSVLENATRNLSRKNTDVRLFDIAPVFLPKELPLTELPEERLMAAGFLTGRRFDVAWNQGNEQVDFYDMKGIVEELLAGLGVASYTVGAEEHFALHPGKTALFKKGRETIATVGELHPQVAENYGIKQKAYLFELDVEVLRKYANKAKRIESLPKYPAVTRDLALVVDIDAPAAKIEQTIAKNGGKYFQQAVLFDVYTGKQVGEGKKSLAYNMHFQSTDKTLTDEEVDAAFDSIVKAVAKNFGAELRA